MLEKIRKFMYGRYGVDRLGQVLVVVSVIFMFASSLADSILLRLISYIILGWCIYRVFSKRTVYRANENMKFKKICFDLSAYFKRDRKTYRYYKCPQCKRTIKVPRKKGKIEITCPLCRNKFIRKT